MTFPQEKHMDLTKTDDQKKEARRKTLKHFAEVCHLQNIRKKISIIFRNYNS